MEEVSHKPVKEESALCAGDAGDVGSSSSETVQLMPRDEEPDRTASEESEICPSWQCPLQQ